MHWPIGGIPWIHEFCAWPGICTDFRTDSSNHWLVAWRTVGRRAPGRTTGMGNTSEAVVEDTLAVVAEVVEVGMEGVGDRIEGGRSGEVGREGAEGHTSEEAVGDTVEGPWSSSRRMSTRPWG